MKTIGIFTTDETVALRTAVDIIYEYKTSGIEATRQVRTKFDLPVEFSDGTSLKWIRPSTNSKGQKVTDAYIDISTCSIEAISAIILPLIVNFDREPDIVIVDNNPDYKGYDLDTLIDRLEKIRAIKGNLTDIGTFEFNRGKQIIIGVELDEDANRLEILTDSPQ